MTVGLFGLPAEVHGAEAQRAHTQAGAAELSIVHAEHRHDAPMSDRPITTTLAASGLSEGDRLSGIDVGH